MTAIGLIFFIVFVFCCVIFGLLCVIGALQEKYATLRGIAVTLYCAGHWRAETVSPHAADILWRRLRDALELAPGTATNLGLIPDADEEYRLP